MKRTLLALAATLTACTRPAPGPPPSILLVTFDTLRADRVGCYGRKDAETPNLDQLAVEGTRFDEARSHVPLTLPSHTTILTGQLPPHHGVRGNGIFRLGGSVPTLATVLRERGYSTAAVVSSVVLDRAYGLDRGFTTYDDNQHVGDRQAFNYLERGASQVAESAARLLPSMKPPFFLWVHLYDPHRPWIAPARFASKHPDDGYAAEIAFADAAFGEIRRAAVARADQRLIVLATADHGESLGEHGENQHGYTLHRGVLRVPLIIAGAGIPAGRTVAELVGLADVAPTLADLAGTALPAADGVSLGRFWGGSSHAAKLDVFWEETLHPLYDSGWAPLRGVVSDGWHFVDAPRPELYARTSDPDDRGDVAASNDAIVRELGGKLAAVAQALGDVPEPPPDATGDEPEDRERLEKLASLGYLASGAHGARSGPRLDPKDGLPGFLALEEAEALFQKGHARQAFDRVQPFMSTDPDNPRLWHAQGKFLLALGRRAEAQQALERSIVLDPRSEFIRLTYADLLRTSGNVAGARAELERILLANPRSIDAALELCAILDASGDAPRAATVLAAAYDAGVRDPDLLLLLGEHLERAGARDLAAARFGEALKLRPDDPFALLAMGQAALRANDAARAIELLSRCADGPKALDCRIELARALVVGPGDLAQARSVLLAAREVAPTEKLRREVELRLRALDEMQRSGR